MAPKDLPAHFKPVQNHLKQFHADCLAYGVTPLSACLDFVIGMPEITRVIVGVCNKNELREILDATALFKSFFNFSRYSWDDDLILNPGNWGN